MTRPLRYSILSRVVVTWSSSVALVYLELPAPALHASLSHHSRPLLVCAQSMFNGASAFNQPLDFWDTSQSMTYEVSTPLFHLE